MINLQVRQKHNAWRTDSALAGTDSTVEDASVAPMDTTDIPGVVLVTVTQMAPWNVRLVCVTAMKMASVLARYRRLINHKQNRINYSQKTQRFIVELHFLYYF